DLQRWRSTLRRPKPTGNLEAADIRQVDVENHEVRPLVGNEGQGIGSRIGLDDRETCTPQRHHLDEAAGVLVVYDENGGGVGHRRTSAGRGAVTTSRIAPRRLSRVSVAFDKLWAVPKPRSSSVESRCDVTRMTGTSAVFESSRRRS